MFHRSQLLLDRANAYEKAGQWTAAIEICESLFDSSWRASLIDDALEALLRLALLYITRSEWELAEEYCHLAREISDRTGDQYRLARSLNALGIIKQREGELSRAEVYFTDALREASDCGHRQTLGDVSLNLGIVAGIRGDEAIALEWHERALTNYEAIGNQLRAARVLNNLGILNKDQGKADEAKECLTRALSICRMNEDIELEGIVLVNMTELTISLRDLDEARITCDEAFEIASELENDQLRADILKSYGVIYRESSRAHLAESHFRQAIDLARKIGNPLLEADSVRELALLLRQSERNQEALAALNTAHQLYADLQAKRHQAEIDERFEQLEADFLRLVEAWGESIEAKDEYTRGHCQRVADYACRLAERAGIPSRDMTWFRMGAFLHDVGKMEVPEEILNKPGKLTDEERLVIERHTVAGDEMLADTEFPYPIRPMVRSHHERWDGGGYPDKLEGDSIPYTARILHVADVYDALTSARSYRKALEAEVAFEIMTNDHGSFEPELLELFREIILEAGASQKLATGVD